MIRSLLGVAFAVVLTVSVGTAQPPNFPRGPSFPQQPGFPNNPGRPGAPNAGFPVVVPEMNSGTCSSCKKEISWTGGSANAPKKCPHCGVKIGYVNNDDGTRTNLASGKTYDKTPLWLGALIVAIAIAVVVVLAIVVGKVVQSQSSGAGKKRGKMKPRRREIEDDDDDDEDDAPRRKRDKPVKRASAADDDFEVLGDDPVPPVEPPRRAKPKLIQPGDGR